MSYESRIQPKTVLEHLRNRTAAGLGGAALLLLPGCSQEHLCDYQDTEMHVAQEGDGVDSLLKRSGNDFSSSADRYSARQAFHELNPGTESGLQYQGAYETPICDFEQ